MIIRVYKYFVKPPTGNADLVHQEIKNAHRYYNRLIELENIKRQQIRTINASVGDIKEMEDKRTALAEQLKIASKEEKKTIKVELQLLKEKLHLARQQLKSNPDIILQLENVNKVHTLSVKSARKNCDVYWGTYLIIEKAVDAATKSTPFYQDVKFRRWSERGAIGIQLQLKPGYLPTTDYILSGNDKYFKLLPETSPSIMPRKRRKTLMIRIGSVEKSNTPIYATFPLAYSRDLPPGIIKDATLSYKTILGVVTWQCTITVQQEETRTDNGKVVAVNDGWRQLPNGIRVAYTSDGQELIVPNSIIYHHNKAKELQGVRHTNFNQNRDTVKAWMETQPIPEQLVPLTEFIALWKSSRKLTALAKAWNQLDPTHPMATMLMAWHKQDDHLRLYQEGEQNRFLNGRLYLYQSFASQLAQKYSTLLLSETDRAEMAKDFAVHTIAHNRYMAAPSILIKCLTNKFLHVVEVPAANITKTCNKCHHLNDFDAAKDITHRCSKCQELFDQDENAALNMLQSYTQDQEHKTSGQVESSRWSKRKEQKKV